MFLRYMHMSSSSTPDSLSMGDLMKLMEDAQPDPTDKRDSDELTEAQITKIVNEAIHSVREQIGDVSAYKFLIMSAGIQLFEFHNDTSAEMIDDGNKDAAIGWARDAGWLQVVLNTVAEICCGPQDFIYKARNPEEFK